MQLLQLILNKKSITLNMKGEHPKEFMLKVCGQEEYLIGDYPLVRFLYIQECLSREVTPTVVVISVNSVQGTISLLGMTKLLLKVANTRRNIFS